MQQGLASNQKSFATPAQLPKMDAGSVSAQPRPLGETQPLKIFINNANTILGQAIVEEIRNDNLAVDSDTFQAHKIVATLSENENAKIPQGITKVVSKNKKKAIYQSILSSDVVVFDVNFGSSDDVDSIVKFLKEQQHGLPKPITFIVTSSVMSWASTEPKKAKELDQMTDNSDFDVDHLSPEDRERLLTTELLDEDYLSRMPSTRFAKLKQIENLVLQLPKFQPSVRSLVVCLGIVYGHGERTLYEHFRKSWTGTTLPLLGDGSNKLPTIHVKDAARLIKKIIFERENTTIALSNSLNLTLSHGHSQFAPLGHGGQMEQQRGPQYQYVLAVDEGKITQR